MTGSSIALNFHSIRGKKTYLTAQKCSKFNRRALLHDHRTGVNGLTSVIQTYKIFDEKSYLA